MEGKYSDLFEGLGTFEKPYTIKLKEGAEPIAKLARRVPHAIMNKLKEKLMTMKKNKIITDADISNEWVNNIVVVSKKDKSLRICLDPTELNKWIVDECFLVPTLQELTADLSGVEFFSVLDLKDGFWHVQLDESSQNLCTFATPFGNFKFLRMPFGIKSAPKVFQKYNHAIFGDIKNVYTYMDDILIVGKTREEHDNALIEVLERARKRGVKFNKQKTKIAVKEVKYFGHTFTKDKIGPDCERIEAIRQMGQPKNKNDLQTFLGVTNYVRPFIPNMSELTAPLRELLKKNIVFNWTERQTNAFNEIKRQIVDAPLLVPFDEKKEIQIQCDASKHGLGCCILQDGKPISFASRSLSEAERNYAQIEKEFLSILFACNKFEFYTFGRKIRVVNDHKPLTSIIKKDIHKIASSKLQNIRLKLLKFDIQLEYAPGKSIHIADYLSRYSIKLKENDEDRELNDSVLSINVSDNRKIEFQKETENDPILKAVKNYCLNGWPMNKAKCADEAKFFFKMRNEIYIDDDILFLNDRIIVPTSMRKMILSQLHESHFGVTKTKRRAKNALYWAGMDGDIEKMIASCHTCQLNAHKCQKEPLIPHSIPMRPFDKIACDIFTFKNKDFLVIVDYYSKWIELKQLKGKKASDVNLELLEVFSRNGIPKVVIADNQPFGSFECKKFAETLDFKFETSSPDYPRSNGLAERAVQICKNMMKKSNNMSEVYVALMEYRSTPTKDLEYSPSQLSQNRMIRAKIPMKMSKFEPITCENVKNQFEKKELIMKKYHDCSAKARKEFMVNDNVYVYVNGKWKIGRVSQKWNTPRSYIIETEDGNYRRNSSHLRWCINEKNNEIVPNASTCKQTRSGRRY